MKNVSKPSAYELEQLRAELEREKKKIHIPVPHRKSRVEKEREHQLLEQMNRKNNRSTDDGAAEAVVSVQQKEETPAAEETAAFVNTEKTVEIGQSPEVSLLKQELNREKYKSRYASVLRSTIGILVVVAAVAILVATLWMPVLQIYGTSMSPTLDEGQVVVSIKGTDIEQGDMVAFYLGNKLLVKRVIAESADIVDIGRDGTVSVNGAILDEPYISEKALGQCDLKFPYQVPDSRYFLMGDHRETSVDSRMSAVGCVAEEQIVGKIICCVWPLNNIEFFN